MYLKHFFTPIPIKKGDPCWDHLYVSNQISEQSGTYASALRAVPSALPGVTAVFGMGTGGAPAHDPPARESHSTKTVGGLRRSDS